MGDVAASGGYYMGMACKTIVAEPLTITGSIGVVTGKFNLAELFGKIGWVSICRWSLDLFLLYGHSLFRLWSGEYSLPSCLTKHVPLNLPGIARQF